MPATEYTENKEKLRIYKNFYAPETRIQNQESTIKCKN